MSQKNEKVWQRPFYTMLPGLILVAIGLVAAFFVLSHYVYDHCHFYVDTVTAPTCATAGCTTHTCALCGDTYTDSYTTADHQYTGWTTVRDAAENTIGVDAMYCAGCSEVLLTDIRPTLRLPCVYVSGNMTGISSEYAVAMELIYDDYETYFSTTALMKVQGFTSAGFAKKNYNVKFYTDDTLTVHQKEDLGYSNWGEQWKYTIKANYIDRSHARNIITCRLWGAMVRTRSVLNEELCQSPNGGCTDGFPIRLYINGAYYGIYTMNIPKDKWMFAMDETVYPHSAIVTSQMHNSTNRFQATTDLVTTSDWDVEYCSTGEDYGWLNDSFNDMIRFIRDKSGAEFRDGIGEYVDVEAAIDYAILCYAMYGPDNWDKNMILITYDGTQWIPCMYDADCAWGLHWNGQSFYNYSETDRALPGGIRENGMAATGNWMMTKIVYNFLDEFKERYRELRESTLSDANIIGQFESFMSGIPQSYYDDDLSRWNLPNPTDAECGEENNINQIRYYVTRHMALMDDAVDHCYRA